MPRSARFLGCKKERRGVVLRPLHVIIRGATDLPLSGVYIAACVLGWIMDVYRKGDRGADGGTIGEIVVAGNDPALLVTQDGR